VEGHICFGGTTCDFREGHGNAFKYANVAYDDISNTRFCGLDWATAIDDCSIGTHCPTGFSEECPDGQSCYGGLSCNVNDIMEELEEEEEANGPPVAPRIDKHSAKRHNFCGTTWGNANADCSMWCPEGENTDCPGGMQCFGSTECYYSDDLVPTATPVQPPTMGPSTLPPVAYKDPANVRYCGITWADAVSNCSVERHCPGGTEDECSKGQTCHGGIMQCNMIDLVQNANKEQVPTFVPTMAPITGDDPRNSFFCGTSWMLARDNCSLETHCSSDNCPDEEICYGGIGCNASEMTMSPTGKPTLIPTDSPTYKPTAPTLSPSLTPTTRTRAPVSDTPTISVPPTGPPVIPADDVRHSYWCGKGWADANNNCHEPCIGGQDTECSDGMSCIAYTACRPATPPPTRKPTTRKPTPSPSSHPTPIPTDFVKPTTNSPVTEAPTNKPIQMFFTMRPTTLPPTKKPTEDYEAEVVYTEPKPAPMTLEPSGKPSPKPLTLQPSGKPSPKPPTKNPTNPPQIALPPSTTSIEVPSQELIATVGSILVAAEYGISNDVLVSIDVMTKEESPTQLYQYSGLINALGVISKGDMGSSYFYLGPNDNIDGVSYGLANVALFIAQAAVETVQFGVCDEISWEKDVFGNYPISNSCGQGRFAGASMVSYEDSNQCAENEAFMACEADVDMTAVAETRAIFAGAPPPLECFPSTTNERFTGAWNPSLGCSDCSSYGGQTMGNIDPLSIPTANSFGTSHVEGCCWWGRGVFPRGSAGTCMIGRLNYYLGKRAFDEGRSSVRYKEIDFCKDPSAICRGHYEDNDANAEIRWLMGMLYWTKVQAYNDQGWSFIERLHEFVDGGMKDMGFLDDVSRIVTRGCHDQSKCGNPGSWSSTERRAKFDKIMDYFGEGEETNLLTPNQTPLPSKRPTFVPTPNPMIPPTPPSLIGGFAFSDSNDDGVRNPNAELEPALTNVYAQLFSCTPSTSGGSSSGAASFTNNDATNDADELLAATKTNTQGFYNFRNILPGYYRVVFQPPAGYHASSIWSRSASEEGNANNNTVVDEVDNAVNPTTGSTECFESIGGTTDISWDVGLVDSNDNDGGPPKPVPTEYPTPRATNVAGDIGFPSPSPIAILPGRDETPSSVSAVSEEDYKLTPAELAQRLNFVNNYCASTSAEAKDKCATSLRTCNFGDPLCAKGLTCYENMVCSIIWSDMELGSAEESPPDISKEIPPESDSSSSRSAVSCNGMCLRPLSASECMAGGDTITSLPRCLDSAIGEMCENQGGCRGGADAYMSNCPGGRDVFIQVFMERCVASATNSPSTDGSHHSLQPTVQASPSSKPSLSAQNNSTVAHNNSDPVDDYVGENEDFSVLARQGDDSRPGAWWKMYETSGSIRLIAMPVLLLLSTTIALVLSEA